MYLQHGETITSSSTAAAASLLPVTVNLDGSLGLLALPGVSLLVPTVNFTVQRAMTWGYSELQEVFRTAAAITGNLTLIQSGPGGTSSSSDTSAVSCQLFGLMYMTSTTYPGPGLTSNYQWSGNVTLSPDPWAGLGLVSPVASSSKRHLLTVHSGTLEEQGQQETSTRRVSRSSRHLAQSAASPGTPASIQVSGSVRVLEYSAVAPNLADEAGRGDGEVWLDAIGAIRMKGKVPESLIPGWKQIQQAQGGAVSGYQALATKLGGVAPFWVMIGGGVLALVLFGTLVWWWCWRTRQGEHQDQGGLVTPMMLGAGMVVPPGYTQQPLCGASYTSSPAAAAGYNPATMSLAAGVRGTPQVYIHEPSSVSLGAGAYMGDNNSFTQQAKARRGSSHTTEPPANSRNAITPWWGEEEAPRTVSPMSRGLMSPNMLRVNSPPTSRSGSPSPGVSPTGRSNHHHRYREEGRSGGHRGQRRSQLGDSKGPTPESPRRSAWGE
jgi:hypothetical protein